MEESPPLARIESVERLSLEAEPVETGFRIIASDATAVSTGIVPDAATCPACIADIRDPANRRYRYPFTNCTNCGPRFSIIGSLPYDRPNTTMRQFVMCDSCRTEYENPLDRRFHAQPNACPVCGPALHCVREGVAEHDGARALAPVFAAAQAAESGTWIDVEEF